MKKNKTNKIKWFAAFADRMKTIGEASFEPQRFGTHKLVHIRTRSQGKSPADQS